MKRFFTSVAIACLATCIASAGMPMRKTKALGQVKKSHNVVRVDDSDEPGEIIYDEPEGEETILSRKCDGFITVAYDATHSTVLGSALRMITADDGTVYFNHIASEYPDNLSWVKASREGDVITIKGPQVIAYEYDYDIDEELEVCVVPMVLKMEDGGMATFEAADDMKFDFNVADDGTLTSADPERLLGVCVHSANPEATGKDLWVWAGFGDRDITMTPVTEAPLAPPADLSTERWVFSDQYREDFVTVGIAGNDFYLQGCFEDLPEAWIKGEIKDGKVLFPSGQYLGVDDEIYYIAYFCGATFTTVDNDMFATMEPEARFEYDAAGKSMTLENGYIINSTPDEIYSLYAYDQVSIAKQHRDPDVAPQAPYDLIVIDDIEVSAWFQLPYVDVDGKLLDKSRLYYEVEVDGQLRQFTIYDDAGGSEDVTLVPYYYNDWEDFWVEGEDHTVYLYGEVKNYVAVRSVYLNEEGKEVRSDECRYDMPGAGIETVEGDRVVLSEAWIDLQGRAVGRPSKGSLVIRKTVYSDGSVKYTKSVL